MSAVDPIQQSQPRIHPSHLALAEVARLDDVARQLMAVQRQWDDPASALRLSDALAASRCVWHDIQTALAENALPLPPDVQHNLLILSVYADSKIDACVATRDVDAVGSLIALTRTLARSLKDNREAA